ncbi:MAG: RNA-binding S4 domain-containing protein [Clostridiales bacterium]|nr:RNA-binding S4 domain-containing protein [Clostridiales bacterium]
MNIEIKKEEEYIKLDKVLKISNIAITGGHAKIIIQNEEVKVNGKIEKRRGKKIRRGDIVEIKNKKIIIY